MTGARPGFLLDEHIPLAVAEGLRRLGIDAEHAVEAGLAGEPDAVVLDHAIEQGLIVVTRDYGDFHGLAGYHAAEGNTIPGIILVPSSIPEREPGALVEALRSWAEDLFREGRLLPFVVEWLKGPRHEGAEGWVREASPSYARALSRLG